MQTAFIIYIRAIGIYCLVTLPAIVLPIMYVISLFYVAVYGWFAWGVFTVVYLVTDHFRLNYPTRMLVLSAGVVAAVLFAYQMLEILHVEENIWESEFILFPVAAIIAGWVSLATLATKVKAGCPGYKEVNDEEDAGQSIFDNE